jgi:hypothetical protein
MPDNSEVLGDRGKALEDEFFRREDQKLINRLRELQQKESSREALAQVSGISNLQTLDRLLELGVRPEILGALAVVPIVEVAWADGSLDAKERQAILTAAEKSGIEPGTTKYELLQSWLDRKPAPNLIAAWGEMIQGMREHMPPQEFESLRKEFIERAHKVARASGGVLGIGATSGAEQDAIARLEAAFRPRS